MARLSMLGQLWIRPRAAIQSLPQTPTLRHDLHLTGLFTLGFTLQLILFLMMVDVIPLSVFISAKGIQGIGWGLLAVSVGFYTFASLTSYFAWSCAKWLKGTGTLAQSRTAILLGMIAYLPVGFAALFAYFAYNQKLMGNPITAVGPLSLLLFPIVFTYCTLVALKLFAETHTFSLKRALLAWLFCCAAHTALIWYFVSQYHTGAT
jgi:hypothetical protein